MSACFFLKDMPPASLNALPWPENTALIAVDPPEALMCGGTDPRCSSAYTRLADSLRDGSGRILPNFIKKYGGGHTVESIGKIAFVGFSAAHGFLDPLAENTADRADISAYLLLDSSFGGNKRGFQAFLRDAVAGKRLLVTATSNTGGTEGWEKVVASTGVQVRQVTAQPPMPEPSGGVWHMGGLAWWYEYGDDLKHWEMSKVRKPMIESYLLPYWQGRLGGGTRKVGSLWPAVGIAAGLAAVWALSR